VLRPSLSPSLVSPFLSHTHRGGVAEQDSLELRKREPQRVCAVLPPGRCPVSKGHVDLRRNCLVAVLDLGGVVRTKQQDPPHGELEPGLRSSLGFVVNVRDDSVLEASKARQVLVDISVCDKLPLGECPVHSAR
jgi:hypothetical protein